VGIAGAAVGPLVFSLIHDITGDYTAVLLVSIIVPTVVMFATFIVRLPQHSEPDASGESHVVNKA
jgi:cyanate permease